MGVDVGTLTSHIGLDTSGLERGAAQAKSVVSGLASNTSAAGRAFADLGAGIRGMLPALGAIAAAGAAFSFMKSSIKAAEESEVAYNDLTAALKRHGMALDSTGERLRAFAADLQRHSTVSDEAIARSMQVFIDYGATGEQAMSRVKVAMDMAAGAHIDLEAATSLLAKASVGATQMLGRYGIIIDDSIPKAEKFAKAISQINERWGGAEAARLETYAGKVKMLANQWDEAKERAGGPMVTMLSNMVSGFNNLITVMTSNEALWKKLWLAMNPEYMRMAAEALERQAKAWQLISAHAGKVQGPSYDPADYQVGPPRMSAEDINAANEAFDKQVRITKELGEQLQKNYDIRKRTAELDVPGVSEGEINAGYETFAAGTQKAKDMAERLRAGAEPLEAVEGGPRKGVTAAWDAQVEAQKRATDVMEQRVKQLADTIESMGRRVIDSLVTMLSEGRANMAAIWRAMFEDFMQYFYSQLIKKLALKIAKQILNTAAPGLGNALGLGSSGGSAMGDWNAGEGTLTKPTAPDVAPAQYPGSSGRQAPYQEPVQVVMIGFPGAANQEYVRRYVIPELQRLRAAGAL